MRRREGEGGGGSSFIKECVERVRNVRVRLKCSGFHKIPDCPNADAHRALFALSIRIRHRNPLTSQRAPRPPPRLENLLHFEVELSEESKHIK